MMSLDIVMAISFFALFILLVFILAFASHSPQIFCLPFVVTMSIQDCTAFDVRLFEAAKDLEPASYQILLKSFFH